MKRYTLVTQHPYPQTIQKFFPVKNQNAIHLTHLAAIWYNQRMNEFHIKHIAPADFELDMLKAIHLGADPDTTCAKYNLIYDQIKDLPHFKTRMEQVEKALLLEGHLTPVVAGIGLHAAVEKLAYRVQDDRIPTGDLVKAIEVLKKVKDGSKASDITSAGNTVSLVINIPSLNGSPERTIEVTADTNPKLQEYNAIEATFIEHKNGAVGEDDEDTEDDATYSKQSDFHIELP